MINLFLKFRNNKINFINNNKYIYIYIYLHKRFSTIKVVFFSIENFVLNLHISLKHLALSGSFSLKMPVGSQVKNLWITMQLVLNLLILFSVFSTVIEKYMKFLEFFWKIEVFFKRTISKIYCSPSCPLLPQLVLMTKQDIFKSSKFWDVS